MYIYNIPVAGIARNSQVMSGSADLSITVQNQVKTTTKIGTPRSAGILVTARMPATARMQATAVKKATEGTPTPGRPQ